MKHWEDTHPQITAGGLWEQNTHTHVSTRVAHRCLHNIPPSLSQMPFSQKIPHYLYTSKALVHLPRNNYNGYDKLATSVLEHCVRESCSHGKHVCHGQGMIPLVNYGVGNSVFSTRKKKKSKQSFRVFAWLVPWAIWNVYCHTHQKNHNCLLDS